jgi:hypothetical protein
VFVQLVVLPQAPSPFGSDTSGQYDQSQRSRLEAEGMFTVVKRGQSGGQGGVFLNGGGGWILFDCLQYLFSLVQDDAEMHHKTTPFQSRSISFPVIIHLHPRHTSMLHLLQNI